VESVYGAVVPIARPGMMRRTGLSSSPHLPVMLGEVLDALQLRPGGLWLDLTLGRCGHAKALLDRTAPDGRLVGVDRDTAALEWARDFLREYGDRVRLEHGNYSELSRWVPDGSCDGALMDLGVSSPQLDVAERGFSFQREGPLDMRMDLTQHLTAAELVNGLSEQELAKIFWDYGEERASRRIAKAIDEARRVSPILTTLQLAQLVEKASPRAGSRVHPATRVFQALRMVVNDESRSLQSGLAAACSALKPGGRLAVITFHSIEDRIVKSFGNLMSRDYDFEGPVDDPELRRPKKPVLRWLRKKATMPGEAEIAQNPRARSAQLRVLEKLP